MVNLTDLSKLKEKLGDVANMAKVADIVKNVTSMVSSDHAAPVSDAASANKGSDVVTQKITDASKEIQNLVKTNAEQAEALSKLNKVLATLSQEIDRIKASNQPASSVGVSLETAKEGATENPTASVTPEPSTTNTSDEPTKH